MKTIITLIIIFSLNSIANAVDITDELELRQVILSSNNAGATPIIVRIAINNSTLIISEQLPAITGNLIIIGAGKSVTIRAADGYNGPMVKVADRGRLVLGNFADDVTISSFSNDSNGGAIAVDPHAKFISNGVVFSNNTSNQNGGAVYCSEESDCSFQQTTFLKCEAGQSGGAVGCLGNCEFNNVTFDGNSANVWACVVDAPFGSNVNINQCTVTDKLNQCNTNYYDVNGGNLKLKNCFFEVDSNNPFASCTGDCEHSSNVFYSAQFKTSNEKTVCNDFGTGAFRSLGYNIDSENGCFLDHATDLANTDPNITLDSNNLPQPNTGSPLIESGSVEFTNNILPCSYKDMNGLGRPQDFDGDGVFTCDRGPVEIQGGADLTNAQSGLYFDMDRSGEGIILEMLGGDSALVTMFTYHPNKTELMWFIGVGDVVGNSIVIDTLQRTSGGVFGSAFNANDIVRTDIGGMSLIFPDCEAAANPGRLTFEAGFEFTNELENMLVKNSRLSRLLNCDQSQPNPKSGRSGTFFDLDRSGEGVFVQVLDNGNAVVIFYTYTPDGKQFWSVSSDVKIDGATLTANMLYPASTTGFSSQFNPDEVNLQPWGTIILEYQPGCSNVNINYNSVVSGFGSGTLAYQRLTQPAGTSCDI